MVPVAIGAGHFIKASNDTIFMIGYTPFLDESSTCRLKIGFGIFALLGCLRAQQSTR